MKQGKAKSFSGKGPLAPKPAKGKEARGETHQKAKKKPRSEREEEEEQPQKAKKKGKKTFAKMGRDELKKRISKVYEDEGEKGSGGEDDGEEEKEEESTIYVKKRGGKLGPSTGGDFDDEEIEEDEAFNSEDETRYDVLDEILKRSKKSSKNNKKKGGKREEEEEEDEEEGFTSPDEDDEEVDISDLLPSFAGDELMKTGKKSRVMQELGDSEGEDFEEDEDEDDEDDQRAAQMSHFIDEMTASRKRKRVEQVTEPHRESEYHLAPKADKAKLGLSDLLQSLDDNAVFSNAKKKLKSLSQAQPISVPLPKIIQDRVDRKVAYRQTKEDLGKWDPMVKENRAATHLSFPLGLPKNEYVSDPKIGMPTEAANSMEEQINAILIQSNLKQAVKDDNRELPDNELTLDEIEDAKAEMKKLRSMMFFYEQKARRLKKIKSKKYHKILKKEKLKKELSLNEIAMLDPERAKEMTDKMVLDRAAERMSLRHKTGGKWAKEMHKKGIVNDQVREATNERNRLSELLRRKIQGEASDSEEEEDRAINSEASDDELDAKFDETVQETEDGQVQATKGLMALKFMKAAEEKQKKQAKEMVERMRNQESEFDDLMDQSEEESDDSADGESDYDEEGVPRRREEKPKKAKEVDASNGNRRKFGPTGKQQPLDDEPEEDASFMKGRSQVDKVAHSAAHKTKVSGPVTVMAAQKKGDALFDLQDFPEVEAKVLNSTKIDFGDKKGKDAEDEDDINEDDEDESDADQEEEEEEEEKPKVEASNKHKRGRASLGGESQLRVIEDEENPWLVPEEDVTLKVKSKKKAVKKEEIQASKIKAQVRQTHQDNSEEQEVIVTTAAALGVKVPPKKAGPAKRPASKQVEEGDDEFATKSEFQIDEEAEIHSFAIQQRDLIQRAFADDDIMEKDFQAEKDALVDSETNKDQDITLPGWGDWGGDGAKPSKKKFIIPAKPQDPRTDKHLKNVIVNEKTMKTIARFTVQEVPNAFRSKSHYDKATRNPVGKEWNSVKKSIELTKPRIATKSGTIIEPVKFSEERV